MRVSVGVLACGVALMGGMAVAADNVQPTTETAKFPFDVVQERLAPNNVTSKSRVYRGLAAPDGAFPFMVALVDHAADKGKEHDGQFCGGSLIKDTWVLTAAHCVTEEDGDSGREVAVAAGSIDIYAGSNNFKNGVRIAVRRVIRHPSYNSETTDFDVALLQLAQPVTGNKISTIQVLSPAQEAALGSLNKPVTATGWGETETGDYPRGLRYVDMKVMDNTMCGRNILETRMASMLPSAVEDLRRNFALPQTTVQQLQTLIKNNAGPVITANMICAAMPTTGKDTCSGDSGGPLFTKNGNAFIQVGITSWGEGCGNDLEGLYGVYSRVAQLSGWINDNAK